MGGTALIAASKYVHVCVREGGKRGRGECVCGWVGGCDCVDVGAIVWVGVGVIVWVKKGVCGWDSLDCCLNVHVCTCMCVLGKGGRRGGGSACVGGCDCVGGCGCDCVGEEGSVWV